MRILDAATRAGLVTLLCASACSPRPSTDAAVLDAAVADTADEPAADVAPDPPDADLSNGALPPPPLSHAVRVIVEPSDHGDALVAAIRAATRSVHVTMYLLSSTTVLDALVAAHRRGVEVQVVLNSTVPGGAPANAQSYATLRTAGVPVHWAPATFAFTHQKTVIVDARDAWIMTMNTTFTSPDANREYLAVDSEPDDVRDAEAIFAADFAGMPYPSYAGRLVLSPLNSRAQLLALIDSAAHTIDIEAEELEDRAIGGELQVRLANHIAIRVVLPDTAPTASAMATITALRGAGADIRTLHSPYIHAKALVIDGVRAYVGSANLSYNSLSSNRELGVLFDTPAEVQRVAATIATDFAAGQPF